MGIERNMVERKGRELCELVDETNTNNMKPRKSRRHLRRRTEMTPVQKLFLACKHVFANAAHGIVPSSQHIEMLRSVLGITFFKCFFFQLGFHILVENLD